MAMMATERAPDSLPTLSLYQLRLPTYEGPLDVLLRLIERSQLAIEDLSLVTVTDQFIAFVATLDDAPPTVIAEFTAVGARLTVIKSRSLLPKPPVVEEEVFVSDLTEQLREYKRLKEVSVRLGERLAQGLASFSPTQYAGTLIPRPPGDTRLASYSIDVLTRTLRRRLTFVAKPSRVIAHRRVVNLRELVERLAHLVTRNPAITFTRYAGARPTRTHAATAFLAVLVLVRRQSVKAQQDNLFGEIFLERGSFTEDVSLPNDAEESFRYSSVTAHGEGVA